MGWPRSQTAAYEHGVLKAERQYRKKMLASQKVAAPGTPQAEAPTGDTVAMNELADVTKTRSILCMAVEDYNKRWLSFKLRMWCNPFSSGKPIVGQLSVMVELVRSGTIYVTLTIFGPHQQCTAKHVKGLGMILGRPKGGFICGEFEDPPDYTYFRCAYDVWVAALIILDAVLPPWLIALADKMSAYDATYGHDCWPLLYQCIDRFPS